jgi:hypothetical protein
VILTSLARVQLVLRDFCRVMSAIALLLSSCSGSQSASVQTTAASTIYVRTDNNATTVWAPRERLAARIADTAGVEATFAADAWTSASIDIVTAATRDLSTGEPHLVHEVRKEVTAGAYYEVGKATLSGGYRYSTENDYWSNGGVGTLALDLASNNTTLVFSAFGSKDLVGRAGDVHWREPQSSLGGRVSLTQVLDAKSLLQVSWETMHVSGYQASPYRFVAIGGAGTCASLAPLCLPESVPDERIRSAGVARVRRALGAAVSAGIEYRFYIDDWGLYSHTIAPDLHWLITEHGTLSLTYRYYTQSDADFYRPRYLVPPSLGYLTRDRELSALYSNRLGLGYSQEFPLSEAASLSLGARAGIARFIYLAFVGLRSVDALEATLMLSLDFR